MKNYSSVKDVTSREIDKHLKNGWEIIDTTRYSLGGPDDTELRYHIGYPLQRKFEELLSIVRLFEEHGFKDKLFEKIAHEEGINLDDFSTGGGYQIGQDYLTLEFIKKYESVVNEKENVEFFKKVKFENVGESF